MFVNVNSLIIVATQYRVNTDAHVRDLLDAPCSMWFQCGNDSKQFSFESLLEWGLLELTDQPLTGRIPVASDNII